MYGCSGEPQDSMGFHRAHLQNDVFRFDPSTNHWDVVDAVGQRPEVRADAAILLVDGKIVIIGGRGSRNLSRRRRKDDFWYRGNNYDLGCRCNYCWDMELTGDGDWGAFESEEEEEVEESRNKEKTSLELGKGEETRACFDSAAEFSSREIAIGEQQVRQELENPAASDDVVAQTNRLSEGEESAVATTTAAVEGNDASSTTVSASPADAVPADEGLDAVDAIAGAFAEKMRLQFRQMPNIKLTPEEKEDVRIKFLLWRMKNDPLSSCYFHDIHVLDLSPSLKTLALMSIADSNPRVDTSYLPPNLHLNLNTMYAFDPEGKKLPALSENEWEMLVYGKGDFR